ncbi:MAG: hypothetical protein IJY62_04510 [Clostridia bacterium]|nr:hypothetical protein [Clostridia bacterium]
MNEKDKKPYEREIGEALGFLLEKGFAYEYTYDKGSDSSCVYIYRFRRGRDYFDLRSVSGGSEGTFVVYTDGQYVFPNLKLRHKKAFRAFKIKHLFKAATAAERWAFAGTLLREECQDGNLFGIVL